MGEQRFTVVMDEFEPPGDGDSTSDTGPRGGSNTRVRDPGGAEAELEALLRGVPVGVGYVDRDLRFLRVNACLAELSGPPIRAHVGRTIPEVMPAAIAGQIGMVVKRVFESGEPVHRQMLASGPPTGRRRELAASCVPVHVSGDLVSVALMVVDVTEQRRSDRTLEFLSRASVKLTGALDSRMRTESLTELLVPEIADVCVVFLKEGLSQVAPIALAATNPEVEERLRALLQEHPDHTCPEGRIARVMRTGESELLGESELHVELNRERQRGGHRGAGFWHAGMKSWIAVPLRAHGRTLGALAIGISEVRRTFDHSDLALVEEVARRAAVAIDNAQLFEVAKHERSRAEEASRLKDEFLATISHELRTPLTAVLGWARLLRRGTLPEEKHARALESIERNALSQTRLIDDLLEVSRIITGQLRLDVRPVELSLVIEAAVVAIRPAVEAKGLVLDKVIDPATGPVLGNADRLRQVMWNLLANAVKFTGQGGRIGLRVAPVDDRIEIVVSDTGQGISRDFLPHVFERFRQADGSATRVHGGLGVGLSIARHLIELHGGTIAVASDGINQGSTFTVLLPQCSEGLDYSVDTPVPSGEALVDLSGVLALVVDDDAETRHLLSSVLELCRAEVRTATTATLTYPNPQHRAPDVILADLGAAGEGISIIRGIRSLPNDRGGAVPAVALMSHPDVEDRTRALRAGFDLHIAKPIDPRELLAVVANVTGRLTQ